MVDCYQLVFTLPWLTQMANVWGRTHGFQRNKEAQTVYQAVAVSVGHRKPRQPLERAELILTRYSASQPDYDGLVLSFKAVVDGLVRIGVLKDDTLSVTGPWRVDWAKVPRKSGHLRIEVRSRVVGGVNCSDHHEPEGED